MKYFVLGPTYIIRLDEGDKIMASLRSLCEQDRIGFGVLNGLGTVSEAEIGWFDREAGDYRTIRIAEPCEIVSLHGNITLVDGKPFPHCHIALADGEFRARGGHLREAVVSETAEIVLTRYSEEIGRKKAGPRGPYLLDLKPEGD